jgi:outer membrane lipoprotein-sorting protein
MKLKIRNWAIGALGLMLALVLNVPSALAQAAPQQKVPMADDVFKNVQLLKGISVSEFMDTMGLFSAALGSNCVHCHVEESLTHWEKFAEDVPRKRRARQMIQMVRAINTANFGGSQAITCYTCHHGDLRPDGMPSLLTQYSLPIEDPNKVEIVPDVPPGPSAQQILDKYIEAIGGAQNASRLTSFVARGTYQGFETYEQKVPIEIFAKSPNQRTTVVHTQNGDTTTVFDGHAGWLASVDKPVTLLPFNRGGELDGARLDGYLSFPVTVKQALTQWRVGFPMTEIDDHPIQVVQGIGEGGTPFKLFFDAESGLLARVVRFTKTIVGTVPMQTDYSDYRDVAGVKMPFKTVVTWTSGQAHIELTEVQPNVAIDPAKFMQPPPAVVKPAVR